MKNVEQIVLAGGCFWCTEAVFQRVKGVVEVVSGFTGGTIKNPAYREVVTGRTGHAEAVRITFQPAEISLKELLYIFFTTHDPTSLNRQGHDVGTQYRSEIFYTSEEQKQIALAVISEMEPMFEQVIVTKLSALGEFYDATEDHQNYYNQHTLQPYCTFVISPKVQKLKQQFSDKLKTQ